MTASVETPMISPVKNDGERLAVRGRSMSVRGDPAGRSSDRQKVTCDRAIAFHAALRLGDGLTRATEEEGLRPIV